MKKILSLVIVSIATFAYSQSDSKIENIKKENLEKEYEFLAEINESVDFENKTIEVKYNERLELSQELKDSFSKKYPKEFISGLEAAYNSKKKYKLSINKEMSNYEFIPVIDNNQKTSNISIQIDPSLNIYKLTKDTLYYENTDFPKKILIKDGLKVFDWQFTTQKTDILKYKTYLAIFEDNDEKIHAYFCPSIPLNNGPDRFWGLPGLILKIIRFDKNSMEYQYIEAEDIIEKNRYKIELPKRKIVSIKQYNNILEEHRNKQREMWSERVDTSD